MFLLSAFRDSGEISDCSNIPARVSYLGKPSSCEFALIRIIYKQICNNAGEDAAFQPDSIPLLLAMPLI